MSSMARKDLAVTREEAPSPEAVPKQDEDPPISPIRQRTVSFADQHHPGHNRSKAAQKAQATNKERDGQSSETASSEPVYEASDSGSSERTASLYDGISSADSNPPTDVYRRADDFTDSDSERAPVRFRSNSVDSVGVGFSLEPPRRATRSGPMPSIAQVYNPTVDRHTIHPGLNTAMGSHQGSMVKADTMTQLALGVISKSALDKPGGGLIIIKKLLTRKTMAEVMKNNRNAFETPYDEEFLEICEDKDSHEKLARLIDSAINLERSREPFVKDPSCAIIYLDNCTEAFKVLDEFFELKKSSWGSGDEDFLLWATGNEHAARENRSFRHSISRARRSLLKRTLPNPRGRLGVHPSEQIPESFCWEPFGFEYLLYLTKDKSMDTDDISKVSKSNVRRLMFTFEFLVPYKCKKRDCDEPRKLLQCGTDTHFHMFVQRRSVLVQNAGSTIAGFHLTPSQDNLCIIADMPVMTNRTSLTSAERPLEQTTESPDVTKRNENLRKRFYRAVGSSKYRFRPAFSLNQESENWYTPALIYFILKDIIECWTPVVQVCIKHVEFREKSVLQDVTLNTHTRNLWEDKQHWIYLRTTLDAHIGNISRLRSYILETFNARLDFMEEMSTDLASRYTEVEKRLEKQLQERTNNLVDLVFSSINSEDAHISAETGTSMWRLSWITFVFLPLTFLAGVFGMNVETFANPENVYIKWYFVTAILMLVFVIAVIWVLKKRIGWKRMLYSIRSVKDACNRAISRIRKSRAKDDADLEANAHLFSETDSESDEPEKDAESTKKQDDKLEATEDDGTTVEPPRGKVSNGEKGSRLNGAADTPSEDVQDEENPDTSDPPEDSNRDREVTIVADILRREQESELGYRGNKEREVDNSRERLRINEVERRQREEILEYEPNLQRERARRRERDRRDMMLERELKVKESPSEGMAKKPEQENRKRLLWR